VQLSLLHIPAIIQHGTMLSLEGFGRWHTSAHILGGWQWRLRSSRTNALLTEKEPQPAAELAAWSQWPRRTRGPRRSSKRQRALRADAALQAAAVDSVLMRSSNVPFS
jgi:hypothetical protein